LGATEVKKEKNGVLIDVEEQDAGGSERALPELAQRHTRRGISKSKRGNPLKRARY
jgi:hypothetical protein